MNQRDCATSDHQILEYMTSRRVARNAEEVWLVNRTEQNLRALVRAQNVSIHLHQQIAFREALL